MQNSLAVPVTCQQRLSSLAAMFQPWKSLVGHLPLAKKKSDFPFVLGSNPISTELASFPATPTPVLAIPDWFKPSTES